MTLPLPRRLWWPWNEPVARVALERRFHADSAVQATLFMAASGAYKVWLDGRVAEPLKSHAPSWRIIHQVPLELVAGDHRLAFEATPGPHGQPFVLACLDWQEQGRRMRLATDDTWRMAADPPEGWAVQATEDRPEAPTWRPAWAFDGVWAEPWGMPCNVPDRSYR